MMEFQLSDFQKYKDYFDSIAQESKDIDGFLFGDVEIAQEEAGSWQGKKLWAWPATRGRMQDPGSDNHTLARDGTLWIGGPCSSEAHADEDAFYNECEAVMKKVVSRLIKEKREALNNIIFNGNTFDRADTRASSTKLIGCQYIFSFTDPDGFEYQEEDWNI